VDTLGSCDQRLWDWLGKESGVFLVLFVQYATQIRDRICALDFRLATGVDRRLDRTIRGVIVEPGTGGAGRSADMDLLRRFLSSERRWKRTLNTPH
jgi:hypothetical protein